MKKLLKLLVFLIFSVALLVVTTATVYAGEEPLVTVIIKADGGKYEIEASLVNGNYCFFLPGNIDKSNVIVKYNGTLLLCDAEGEPTLYKGDTLMVDASGGTIKIKEHNSERKSTKTYTYDVMFGGSIGSVYITLDGGDKDFKRVNSSKDFEAEGNVIVADKAGNTVYNGLMSKLSGHGFTSFQANGDIANVKNSFNFNIPVKSELIYGAGDAKKWVLLTPRRFAGDRDESGLSQVAAFTTYSAIIGNKRASIEGEYVDLYVNGEYRGLYILTERMNDGGAIDVKGLEDYVTPSGDLKTIRSNENTGRDPALNAGIQKYTYDKGATLTDSEIDITGGYVLEVMCGMYEGCGFKTKHGLYFSIKSPEACTKEMVRYIATYVQNFENAIYSETGYNSEGKHYSEYVDMRSLADTILVYAYYINFEYFRTSTYVYKDADGEANDVLTFGPAWDFETRAENLASDKTLFGTTNWFTYNVEQQYIWSEQLWQHGDFMECLVTENERMKAVIMELTEKSESTSVPSLRSITDSAAASADMNYERWGGSDFNSLFNSFISAVEKRYEHWYGELWDSDEYLLFVTVDALENEDGTITLTASSLGGDDGIYKWYRVDPDDLTSSKLFATRKDTVTVEADGSIYYCTITGKNNAYYEYASGEIFSDDHITMKSCNVSAVSGDYLPETEPPETESDTTTDTGPVGENNGCRSSISFVVFPMILGIGIPLTKKRKTLNKQN